eukprot:7402960-Karenia_brevis.AAC.1
MVLPNGVRKYAYVQAPDKLINNLRPRKTQIIPLELVAMIAGVWTWVADLEHRPVLVFCDNIPAAQALSKGSSPQIDLQ